MENQNYNNNNGVNDPYRMLQFPSTKLKTLKLKQLKRG